MSIDFKQDNFEQFKLELIELADKYQIKYSNFLAKRTYKAWILDNTID